MTAALSPSPIDVSQAAPPQLPRGLVGMFDSGVGGLSVLAALTARLPHTPMIYIADSGNAPYGDRHDDHAMQRTLRLSQYLVDQGACLLVIACNTATAAAIAIVRERWPQLAVVGVEPGVKPAIRLSRNGRIGVMATPATLRSDKFVGLVRRHAADGHLVLQPCAGLAQAIESGDVASARTVTLMQAYCQPLRDAGVDTVVLGCTHYAFVRPQLQALLGEDVKIVDTAEAVARQAAALHEVVVRSALTAMHTAPGACTATGEDRSIRSLEPRAMLTLISTGDATLLSDVAQRWLSQDTTAKAMPDL